jgi:hypothetical protein
MTHLLPLLALGSLLYWIIIIIVVLAVLGFLFGRR